MITHTAATAPDTALATELVTGPDTEFPAGVELDTVALDTVAANRTSQYQLEVVQREEAAFSDPVSIIYFIGASTYVVKTRVTSYSRRRNTSPKAF